MVRAEPLGLPLSDWYGIECMLVTALTGIRPGLSRIAAFGFGGTLAGVAGVVLTGRHGSATASGAANSLLLPIFAAVFLGSTAFTPGSQNVPGLFVAVLFLAFVSRFRTRQPKQLDRAQGEAA